MLLQSPNTNFTHSESAVRVLEMKRSQRYLHQDRRRRYAAIVLSNRKQARREIDELIREALTTFA
jgi:hypothetical protein